MSLIFDSCINLGLKKCECHPTTSIERKWKSSLLNKIYFFSLFWNILLSFINDVANNNVQSFAAVHVRNSVGPAENVILDIVHQSSVDWDTSSWGCLEVILFE